VTVRVTLPQVSGPAPSQAQASTSQAPAPADASTPAAQTTSVSQQLNPSILAALLAALAKARQPVTATITQQPAQTSSPYGSNCHMTNGSAPTQTPTTTVDPATGTVTSSSSTSTSSSTLVCG